MKTFSTMAFAASLLVFAGGTASAQSKTFEGKSVTTTATIVVIEQPSRTLTVKDDKGFYETIQAPPAMTRFSELKVGDKITARYYENVVISMKRPGEAPVDMVSGALTGGKGAAPGGTLAEQRTMTVTVTAKDPKAMSATVKGPNGYLYSRRVVDKKIFDMLKIGDQLDMTWTNAMLISVDPAK